MAEKKISPPSWKKQLRSELAILKSHHPDRPRLALLGIGNPLNGDDAVGGYVADRLKTRLYSLSYHGTIDFYAVNTGPVPENFTGAMRKFAPHLIIMVDAANIDSSQGGIEWIPMEAIAGFSASTHGLPLSMLAGYLVEELKCQIGLIGIEVGVTGPGLTSHSTISRGARAIANKLVRFLASELSS